MQRKCVKTQAERLSDELIAIKPDVTAADRKALEEETGFTRGTISAYLNGRVDDNDCCTDVEIFP
jgi:hypothetical protein